MRGRAAVADRCDGDRAHGDLQTLFALRLNIGDVWLLLAMVIWAIYTVLLRWSPVRMSTGASLAAMILFGLPPLAVMYAVLRRYITQWA